MKENEPQCIVCGARMRSESGAIGRTAGAMLMGLSLTACPTDDTMGDSMASESTATPTSDGSSSDTTTMGMSSTTVATDTGSSTAETTDPGSDSTTFSSESAYGVPTTGTTIVESATDSDTDTDTVTGTDTDTGTTAAEESSTSVSPDYGVPETRG